MEQQLNPLQHTAASHVKGPALVIAGAGSGKTRIIIFRICYLLKLGVPSDTILAVTFTNKAAQEMSHRVHQQTHANILTCTFHSLGARILRESIQDLGYSKHFTIYDEDDSEKLIKDCAGLLNLKGDKSFFKYLRSTISSFKNNIFSLEKPLDPNIQELFHLYQSKLKEYHAVDFDDLLYLPIQLFQQFPQRLEYYQKKWNFILIDEYQDTNATQHQLIKLLSSKHQNIFAVGDPDQSIYSWRGAKIDNILNFEIDFPGALIITLEQNYRSRTHILNAANHLIQHNPSRYKKNLWSDLGPGEKVQVYLAETDHEEAEFIVKKILSYQNLYSLNDCVIFYRTNFQSRIFEDTLLKFGVPYQIIGGLSFYQRREIKDILSYLRIVVGGSDFISFARTINLPKRGLGENTIQNLKERAENSSIAIFDYCLAISQNRVDFKLSGKQLQGIKEYVEMILSIREMAQQKISLQTIIAEALEKSRYLDYLKEDRDTYEERRENIVELVSKAAQWEEENPEGLLSDFLEELTLKTHFEGQNQLTESVKLMTLHLGKGLEFSVVFIVGLEEDIFPHLNSKEDEKAIEEERRLFYVGMTRAKEYLYLTAAQFRFLWGAGRMMKLSRFYHEIPPAYLKVLSRRPLTSSPLISDPGENLKNGDSVYHKDFGSGIIKKCYETSLGLTYDVYFPESGLLRSLVAQYAKLSRKDTETLL